MSNLYNTQQNSTKILRDVGGGGGDDKMIQEHFYTIILKKD